MFGSKGKSSPSNKKNANSPTIPGMDDDGGGLNDLIEDIDMNQIDGMLKKDIKEDDITLTEDDMDDPDLLSQLSQIESGGKLDKPNTTHAPPPTATAKAPAKKAAAAAAAVPPPLPKKKLTKEEEEERMLMEFGDGDMPQIEDEDDDVDFEEQISMLSERVISYKRSAMAANQGGDKQKALGLMRSVKALEQAIGELQNGIPVDIQSLPPPIGAPVSQPSRPSTSNSNVSSPVYSSGGSNPSSVRSTTPISSPPVRSSPKLETMSKEKVEQEERLAIWELFEEEYKKKHHFLTTEAIRLKNIDKHKALVLFQESKGIHALIDQIEICKQAMLPPPPYRFEDKVTQTEITMPHLKDTELEILIGKIELPSSVGAVDTYIQGELPYPSAEQPAKFQTATISASAANYNFKNIVQIERKNTIQRVLKNKKLTLTITSPKMFFMKSVIGRCEVKLSDLLVKCEYIEKSPILKEGTKKPTGGYVEVTIRLKTPLNEKEYKRSSERVLVIQGDLGNLSKSHQSTSSVTSAPTPTSTPSTTQPVSQPTVTPTTTSTTTTSAPVQQQPKPATDTTTTTTAATTTTKPTTTTPTNEDDEEEDVEDVNRIVSNDVFEFMMESINQQIAQSGPKPDLMDKKQALEIKMMVLETQVASGMLTVNMYMKQLEEAIVKDKQWAQKLVKEGKKDKAIKIMKRVKIMEKELESGDGEE